MEIRIQLLDYLFLKPEIHLKASNAICPKTAFSPSILTEKSRQVIHLRLQRAMAIGEAKIDPPTAALRFLLFLPTLVVFPIFKPHCEVPI
ncbi:hypothetical protein AVEN_100294-1 [Araneus ventricosus]|uniref:Uncharacterized protein n=1 Tax=Araneus ventricosus TaxID=182803 RepID=A0A4Y2U0M5_ARAVE|nr:hypothetical protein AVEN_100294-1 [Araneus ventricosus]